MAWLPRGKFVECLRKTLNKLFINITHTNVHPMMDEAEKQISYEENFEVLQPTLTHEALEEKMETAYEEQVVIAEIPKAEEVTAVVKEQPVAEPVAEESV